MSGPATVLQATFTGPELTLFRGQTSSPAVGELAADLETVAESCLVAESCASVRCAEVGHIFQISPSCSLSGRRTQGRWQAVGKLQSRAMWSIPRFVSGVTAASCMSHCC